MIDTDKYEGHTPAPWMNLGSDANSLLMQDAPLLLEEVKRLQKEVRKQSNIIGVINDLVYDDGSYNLTWDKFNEIMEMN